MSEELCVGLFGMTSLEEQKFFRDYVLKTYTGTGAIVDLGSWLGSTTIPLAMGLRARTDLPAEARKVHAYDRFIWEAWMEPYLHGCMDRHAPGDTFLPEYMKRVARWIDLIDVHAGDLLNERWSAGPVEFLLVDVMKSWELANFVVTEFFPQLIPGVSQVVHQDFKHFYTSWIHLVAYEYRDRFELVESIPQSASVVMKCVEAIPRSAVRPLGPDLFSDAEVDAAFDYSMSLVRPVERSAVVAAKAMWFVHRQENEKAARVLEHHLQRGDCDTLHPEVAAVLPFLRSLARGAHP
jgi:hypothetical protein